MCIDRKANKNRGKVQFSLIYLYSNHLFIQSLIVDLTKLKPSACFLIKFVLCNCSYLNSLTHLRSRVWQVVIVVDIVLHFLWNLDLWVVGFKFDVEFFLWEGWSFRLSLFLLLLTFFAFFLFGGFSELLVNLSFKFLFKTNQSVKSVTFLYSLQLSLRQALLHAWQFFQHQLR